MTSRPVRPRSRLTLEPGLRELGGEAFVLNKFLEGQLGTVCFVARREHGRRGGLPGLGPEVGEFGGRGSGGSCGLRWGAKDQGRHTLICTQRAGLAWLFPHPVCGEE